MPMTNPLSSSPISQQDLAQFDDEVMRHAFECQNQLGRLGDEVIYQNDVADYEQHLRALLCLGYLRTVPWVNRARPHVRLASLTR
jgi:hypothetical protein